MENQDSKKETPAASNQENKQINENLSNAKFDKNKEVQQSNQEQNNELQEQIKPIPIDEVKERLKSLNFGFKQQNEIDEIRNAIIQSATEFKMIIQQQNKLIDEKFVKDFNNIIQLFASLAEVNLNFESTQITKVQLESLIKELTNSCVSLQIIELNFRNNNLNSKCIKNILQDLSQLLKLKKLTINLDNNYIGAYGLDIALEGWQKGLNVEYLDIDFSNNSLQFDGALLLFQEMKYLKNIVQLKINLEGNSIQSQQLDEKSLMEGIVSCKLLQEIDIDLSNNSIGDSDVADMALQFFQVTRLKKIKLVLWENQVTFEGYYNFFQNISKCKQLEELDVNFDDNQLNEIDESIAYNFSALYQKMNKLLFLSISLCNNQLSSLACSTIFKRMDVIAGLKQLNINLRKNNLTAQDCIESFENFSNIQYLAQLNINLSKNRIESNKYGFLNKITSFPFLQKFSLDLSLNSFDEKYIGTVLKPLSNTNSIKQLSINLSACGIKNIGIQSVAEVLFQSYVQIESLELNLSNNMCQLEYLYSYLECLKQMRNLVFLSINLRNNGLGSIEQDYILNIIDKKRYKYCELLF
ncbi:hypothetical protein TTHERM_00355180 (macronuclear) [Tetrahymena thermophila SB210]|uniref:Kinase domain protein n=1 Tax=Tetrahymena thermophila (strain SB210) TaxID=312017 RepID=Q22Y53_TETTS|nr:hypothetical protein TTHERM_00355180 [Tetrahymena thermophila SB210]EAR90171.2 hypothetical protein TTHERM_00355180 [Tetrahymena thermophila SB210]|eukprot:XP_001010416.2 hypothetical protein TTHERM_00355180 [Tetrahymena thermophila SB210]